mmetsp:Transcript_32932/g.94648  ORF Transcript_32932/g.94648 Transcript_32932/m.94648 type:complete len:371 (-) Transcript_32932:377-1489(-)
MDSCGVFRRTVFPSFGKQRQAALRFDAALARSTREPCRSLSEISRHAHALAVQGAQHVLCLRQPSLCTESIPLGCRTLVLGDAVAFQVELAHMVRGLVVQLVGRAPHPGRRLSVVLRRADSARKDERVGLLRRGEALLRSGPDPLHAPRDVLGPGRLAVSQVQQQAEPVLRAVVAHGRAALVEGHGLPHVLPAAEDAHLGVLGDVVHRLSVAGLDHDVVPGRGVRAHRLGRVLEPEDHAVPLARPHEDTMLQVEGVHDHVPRLDAEEHLRGRVRARLQVEAADVVRRIAQAEHAGHERMHVVVDAKRAALTWNVAPNEDLVQRTCAARVALAHVWQQLLLDEAVQDALQLLVLPLSVGDGVELEDRVVVY